MKIETLSGLVELIKLLDKDPEETTIIKEGTNIVILQRGWVVVGDLSWDGKYGILSNASVIRNWGTENGLGELAINGPTEKTKLDKCEIVKFHELTSVAIIPCKSKW